MPLRLEGWKQIAAYMKRDVSTVQRWEKQSGLPVHRHRHGRRDVPYAYATDLDEWWGLSGPAPEESNAPAAGAKDQGTASPGASQGVRSLRLLRALLVIMVPVAAVAVAARWYTDVAPARVSLQLLSPLPEVRIRNPAVSADGRRIAFIGQPRVGPTRLWVRALSAGAPQLLPESDEAILPFWSPDASGIGYFAHRQLKIVGVENSTTRVLADAAMGSGGTWGRRGVIVFARQDGLYKVSSSGGTPERVTALAKGEASHRHPQFLPDGEHFVFSVWGGPGSRRFELKIGSVAGIEPVMAAATAFSQAYAPPGYLLFGDAGSLVAQPFEAKRLRSIGEAHTIADRLSFDDFGRWAFSVSDNGVLVYATERARATELVRMNRDGQRSGPSLATGSFDGIALSHDGRRIAVAAADESTRSKDIWMIDAVSGATVRLTHDPEAADSPLWSPDDTRIVFSSARNTTRGDLFIRPATVDGADELLWSSPLGKAPQDWTTDGRLLFAQQTSHDVWIMPLGKDRQPVRVLGTNAQPRSQSGHEVQARLSPDQRVLAYTSNVTGRWEVYLQSYPPADPPVQISSDGGDEPRWSSDGRELFYRSDNAVMSVRVTREPRLQGAVPIQLFTVAADRLIDFTPTSMDRFLVNVTSGPPGVSSLTVVLNWNATKQ